MVEGLIFDILITYIYYLKETSKETGKCDCLVNYWHATSAYRLIKIENSKFHLKFITNIKNSHFLKNTFV